MVIIIGERERANLIVTTGTIFLSLSLYIYIYNIIYLSRAMPYRNRLRVSKLTQLTIFHRSSPRVYRQGDSSRRCTVATVQDEANPSSSQPAASCCVASESTEAHRDGWRKYVLAEESVLPRKQPKRKRGVYLHVECCPLDQGGTLRADVPPAQPPAATGG